jgi:RNA polymerase sigma factor (sigma-70 family)
MKPGETLFAEYIKSGSEIAFRELVDAYLGLVYSSAFRLVDGNHHFAQDVSQIVFTDLAMKAKSLSSQVKLGGWLHRRTCFVAAAMMRGHRRRQARERRAISMNATEDYSEQNKGALITLLDQSINELNNQDRVAVIMRFFEQQDLAALGSAMGTTEDAAQKRVSRALVKLRTLLSRHGFSVSAATLATVLCEQTISAIPAGLAGTITSSALAAASTATALTFFKILTMTKIKIAAIGLAAVAAFGVPLILLSGATGRLKQENTLLHSQLDQIAFLTTDNDRLQRQLAEANSARLSAETHSKELLRLRGEVGRLRLDNQELAMARREASKLVSKNDRSEASVADTSTMRQAIYDQLSRIQLEAIVFDDSPLSEVAKILKAESKQRDPAGKGINFYLTPKMTNSEVAAGTTNGLEADADLEAVSIKLSLKAVRLIDVLDSIPHVASQPIQFSIETNGVAFSFRDPEQTPPLFMRIMTADPVKVSEVLKIMDLKPPKSASLSGSRLVVRATRVELDQIEAGLQTP